MKTSSGSNVKSFDWGRVRGLQRKGEEEEDEKSLVSEEGSEREDEDKEAHDPYLYRDDSEPEGSQQAEELEGSAEESEGGESELDDGEARDFMEYEHES